MVGMIISNLAIGQGVEVCKELVKFGTYDQFDSFSDRERFNLAKHAVCSTNINTYRSAEDQATSLGVNVIDIVEVAIGREVNESNFQETKSDFCGSSYADASGSSRFMSRIRRASGEISSAFQNCVYSLREGFSAYVTQSRNKEAFSVHLTYVKPQGTPEFKITQFSAQPASIECAQNEHMASPRRPVTRIGGATINCVNKTPDKSFLLAVNTDAGSLTGKGGGGVELPGTEDTISDLKDRLDRMESGIVPTDTVAYFTSANCPPNWTHVPGLIGRYVVGTAVNDGVGNTVGNALSAAENRAISKHSHRYTDTTFAHPNGWANVEPGYDGNGLRGPEWRHDAPVSRGASRKNTTAVGTIEGTNAPYMRLLACKKD